MKARLGEWAIYYSVDDDGHLTVSVKHDDNSTIIALDADIGSENEWGERFTTLDIEEEYKNKYFPSER